MPSSVVFTVLSPGHDALSHGGRYVGFVAQRPSSLTRCTAAGKWLHAWKLGFLVSQMRVTMIISRRGSATFNKYQLLLPTWDFRSWPMNDVELFFDFFYIFLAKSWNWKFLWKLWNKSIVLQSQTFSIKKFKETVCKSVTFNRLVISEHLYLEIFYQLHWYPATFFTVIFIFNLFTFWIVNTVVWFTFQKVQKDV